MTNTRVHDFPGRQTRLEYIIPENLSRKEADEFVINSIFSFADGLVEILAANLWITYYDIATGFPVEDSYPEMPFWMLKKKQLPENIRVNAAWENEKMVETEEISPSIINSWITDAVAANHSPDASTGLCWKQIIFPAMKCCTQLPYNSFDELEITVEEEGRVYQHPIEKLNGKIWITGPLHWKSLSSPIRIIIDNFSGLITLDISLYWSFWTDPDAAGTKKVQESIQKLLEKEWTFSS